MIKRFILGASALLWLVVAVPVPGQAQGISQKVAPCDWSYPSRCLKVNTDGSINTNPATGATSDVNLKQVNGATVNVGAGAAGTGTQRVTTSTDSTIGTITNPVGAKGADGSTIASVSNPGPVAIAPTASSALGVAPAASAAAESCKVLKASAGNLYSVTGYAGAASFLMVFNATAAPADGAVTPVVWAYTPTAGSWSIDYGSLPAAFSTGITVCASSTGPLTKTAIATNNVFSGRTQ